jgi:hypothetical protein
MEERMLHKADKTCINGEKSRREPLDNKGILVFALKAHWEALLFFVVSKNPIITCPKREADK